MKIVRLNINTTLIGVDARRLRFAYLDAIIGTALATVPQP